MQRGTVIMSLDRKYFGTDGIRGYANKSPMTAETAMKVGMAAGVAVTVGVLGTAVGLREAFVQSTAIEARIGAFPVHDVVAIAVIPAIWGGCVAVVAMFLVAMVRWREPAIS